MNTFESATATIAAWEEAYAAFETPAQEVEKFLRRLRSLGVAGWDPSLRVLELCCGRGSGLEAWQQLGFANVEGLDISAALLEQYQGSARVHVGDARAMPFDHGSFDVVCVQGGLHHLEIMDDLQRSIDEAHRVLRPDGRLVLVEPWLTPFLRFVHAVCARPTARRLWSKLDALQTMIDLERSTYEPWLATPTPILKVLQEAFAPRVLRRGGGKLMFVGVRRG